ncbi:imm11 family protein [Myxococcus xanthus]|uniref:Immunity MXAN-0049 protein domain-containing protein n=1 Tax=Myxococcus xanthus TaxID=34 RepID=A0AAE6G7D0_MYXXA|nr:DUF1629 domain-containing protein [Myxococcus xanthus]QDE72313.1 hypothetical protein BHS09_06455 [Myxococcus xanthus]QDE79596.1 hypothetical protein BHS08_06460 [Myxococcus xanthus]QDE81213.1 hypothetical protein BHS07_06350 [Myxococcus xanthus]QDF02841.1 hypothetical protein BHS04_06360 [Myxococcus xanthus]
MDYWVLKAESADGAIIDALPEGSPTNWKFSRGEPLARQFPAGGKVSFSDHFPDRRQLYDFVRNTVGVLLVSSRVKQVLENLQVDNAEFLPVTMCDHQWSPVAEGYGILNVLGSQDVIDLERSKYRLDRITKKEIARLNRMAVASEKVDPKADIFRARNMMELILISDRTKQAFEQAGLTGFRAHPAEGFDDMFA